MAGYSGYGGPSGYGGSSGHSVYGGSTAYSGYGGPSGHSEYGGPSGYSRYGGPSSHSGYGGPSGLNGRSGQTGRNSHSVRSGHSGYSGYSDDWESHLYGEISSRQGEQRQQPQQHRRRHRIVPSRQCEVYYSASDLENQIDSNDEESWNGGYVSLAESHLYENVEFKKRNDAYTNSGEQNTDSNETETIYESLQQNGSASDENYVKTHHVGIKRQDGIDLPDSSAKISTQPRRILPETGQEILARPRHPSPTPGSRLLPNTPLNKNSDSAPVQNQPTHMHAYTVNQLSTEVSAPPHVQSEVNAPGQTQLMVVQPLVIFAQPGCITGYLNSVFYLCHNTGCNGPANHRQC